MDHYSKENSTSDEVKILTILNKQILQAEEDGNAETLATLLTEDFTIIRASGAKQDRETYLNAGGTNAHRDRTSEEPEIRLYRDCAVVIIRLTTSEKQNKALTVHRFWNTRVVI